MNERSPGDSRPAQTDRLDYVADMIAELREMTTQAGLETLSGILALAEVEAAKARARERARATTLWRRLS